MANYGTHPGELPGIPGSVANAVKLMWAGAAISLVGFVIGMIQVTGQRDELEAQARAEAIASGLSPEQVDSVISSVFSLAIGFAVLIGLVGAGLWAWMAIKNRGGRNWARVLSTVLFGLLSVSIVLSLVGVAEANLQTLFGIGEWLVGLIAIVLIWRQESAPHYARPAHARGPAEPPYPQT